LRTDRHEGQPSGWIVSQHSAIIPNKSPGWAAAQGATAQVEPGDVVLVSQKPLGYGNRRRGSCLHRDLGSAQILALDVQGMSYEICGGVTNDITCQSRGWAGIPRRESLA
jgi:hypothetical protein